MSKRKEKRQGFLIHMNEMDPLFGKTLLEIVMKDRKPGDFLESRRWMILISFSLFSNAMLWITFSPIAGTVMSYYNTDTDGIIALSDSYMYLYIVLSFVGSWCAMRHFSASLLTAMVISLCGAWMRYFSGDSFQLVLLGQYMCGLAQTVILFVPVLLADIWFAAHETMMAVSIGAFANIFGWGVGFMFPTMLISNDPDGLPSVLFWEAVIASIPFLIGVFFIRDRPKVPPSFSALTKLVQNTGFLGDIKSAMQNKSYIFTALCFANITGQAYTFSSVIVLFLQDLTIMLQGVVGFIFIMAAIISGMFGTYLVSKSTTGNFDRILRIFMHVSMFGLIALAVLVKYKMYVLVAILNAFLGVGLLGSQPFACQSLTETTFPVQESVSVNFMMVGAQIFGVIGNYFTTAPWVGDQGLWSMVGLILPCWIYITFFFKTDFRKRAAEKVSLQKYESIRKSISQEDFNTEDTLEVPMLSN